MLHNDRQPNKLCDCVYIQNVFNTEGEGDSIIRLIVFYDMLVIDVISKMLLNTLIS